MPLPRKHCAEYSKNKASLVTGLLLGEERRAWYTLFTQAQEFMKESVNVFVNDPSHMVRSITEQHTCTVSGRIRN